MPSSLIIVGGGVGGLAAAIALARRNIQVTVIERASEFKAIGYGIQLGPNAFHALQHLGLHEAVLSKCSLPDAGYIKDAATGEILLSLPMGRDIVAAYDMPYAVIHRSDLHQVLVDACAHSGITLVTDCELLDFHDRGDGVDIVTSKGDMTADALIAADGNGSMVRARLFDTRGPEQMGYAAFRAVHPMSAMPERYRKNEVVLWAGAGHHMIHYPLRGGTLFNLVAAFDYSREADDAEDAFGDRLVQRFADDCPETAELLSYLDFTRHWEITSIEPLASWTKGRIALAGDAAHAMVQAMAQGACQAIEDGVALGECLGDSTGDLQGAFREYERRRLLRATRVQYMSRFMWEAIHVGTGFARLRREMFLKMKGGDVLATLGWLYGRAE
jgi:salicylate hydroxylase